jgi:hypothetical protein
LMTCTRQNQRGQPSEVKDHPQTVLSVRGVFKPAAFQENESRPVGIL